MVPDLPPRPTEASKATAGGLGIRHPTGQGVSGVNDYVPWNPKTMKKNAGFKF